MSEETPVTPAPKAWYDSKTVWIGILTALSGVLPLVLDFLKVVTPDYVLVSTAVVVLVLGVIQVVRRVFLDPEASPRCNQEVTRHASNGH